MYVAQKTVLTEMKKKTKYIPRSTVIFIFIMCEIILKFWICSGLPKTARVPGGKASFFRQAVEAGQLPRDPGLRLPKPGTSPLPSPIFRNWQLSGEIWVHYSNAGRMESECARGELATDQPGRRSLLQRKGVSLLPPNSSFVSNIK